MASACVNNIGRAPESFLDCPPAKFSSYGWLSPRISFTREFPEEEASDLCTGKALKQPSFAAAKPEVTDPESSAKDLGDFEFCLEDPVAMLPADELFSDGKLVPLHISVLKPAVASFSQASREVMSPDKSKLRRRNISIPDPYLFSPKAPRCTSRWKELLGLKRLYQKERENNNQKSTPSSLPSTTSAATKSLKNLLHLSTKSSMSSSLDSSLNLPLLKDSDNESVSISSSRLSLSSSSSGHEHDDLPRLSLDADIKPSTVTLTRVSVANHQRGVRAVKPRRSSSSSSSESSTAGVRIGRSPMRRHPDTIPVVRGVSVDSPRMNSSGKIVFHSLERSSSSPSSYGGPRYKHRGMERSYSANVRVTPVLNVPVCSLRGSSKSGGVFGFPIFSSSQPKKDSVGSINGSFSKGSHHHQQLQYNNSKHRADRN